MDKPIAMSVRLRAKDCCEYCRQPQSARLLRFQIEHIIARQHGGDSTLENLALACGHCNRHKGTNLAGIDTETQLLTRLFHPRTDQWQEHFRWDRATLIGLTSIGRTTIHVLNLNAANEIAVRSELIACGYRFPP